MGERTLRYIEAIAEYDGLDYGILEETDANNVEHCDTVDEGTGEPVHELVRAVVSEGDAAVDATVGRK